MSQEATGQDGAMCGQPGNRIDKEGQAAPAFLIDILRRAYKDLQAFQSCCLCFQSLWRFFNGKISI